MRVLSRACLLSGLEQIGACNARTASFCAARPRRNPRTRSNFRTRFEGFRSPASPSTQQTINKQVLALAASGAVLGPLCDGQHSKYGVLHYTQPTLLDTLIFGGQLETCWWVPVLFGLAAVILGTGHTLLDRVAGTWKQSAPLHSSNPSWPLVITGIVSFVLQYAASGALEAPLLQQDISGLPLLDLLLSSTAILHWYLFDRSVQGLLMALVTAIAGPVTEIVLINKLGLYHYSHPTWWGIPTWIPWVYFCGSAAVGNLGRKVEAVLASQAKNAR